MAQHTSTQHGNTKPLYGIGDIIKVIVVLAILVGAMALLAGRWDWIAGWAFIGVFFIYSLALFLLGFAGMVVALFNYRNTPADQPVNQGLYRISRNPQWVSLAVMFLGTCIAIGSWLAVILFAVAVVFYHFRILGEERACLASYGEPYRDFMRRVPRYFLVFEGGRNFPWFLAEVFLLPNFFIP